MSNGTEPYSYYNPSPAAVQLVRLLQALNNANYEYTGVRKIVKFAQGVVGPKFPLVVVGAYVKGLNNLFGNYPSMNYDFAPSIVFTVVFFVIGIIHLALYFFNLSRGHFFYISLLWCFIALGKSLGFGLRVGWGTQVVMVDMGLTSEVFLIVSSVALATVNLILAQRLFTWRHPVGGSRKLFDNTMLVIYFLVCLIVAMTIVSSSIYYIDLLSHYSNKAYQIATMVSSVTIILYSLTAILLVFLSYFFKPTRKDENLYTYQPWWVESFHPFYFVKKNASKEAAETFMKRNHNHRHAVRVIAATHHHYNMVEGLTNQRGDLSHNKSILIVTITTILAFVEALLRAIVCFKPQATRNDFALARPIVAYICWGVLETLIHVLYLVGRVDLRFYRPDKLPAKVRAIITAEQSYNPSDNDDTSEEFSTTEDHGFVFDDTLSQDKEKRLSSPPNYETDTVRNSSTKDDDESVFRF